MDSFQRKKVHGCILEPPCDSSSQNRSEVYFIDGSNVRPKRGYPMNYLNAIAMSRCFPGLLIQECLSFFDSVVVYPLYIVD